MAQPLEAGKGGIEGGDEVGEGDGGEGGVRAERGGGEEDTGVGVDVGGDGGKSVGTVEQMSIQ